jgi:hypothetical protein
MVLYLFVGLSLFLVQQFSILALLSCHPFFASICVHIFAFFNLLALVLLNIACMTCSAYYPSFLLLFGVHVFPVQPSYIGFT